MNFINKHKKLFIIIGMLSALVIGLIITVFTSDKETEANMSINKSEVGEQAEIKRPKPIDVILDLDLEEETITQEEYEDKHVNREKIRVYEDELIKEIYSDCSKNSFEVAYLKMETFLKDNPEKLEEYNSIREDINTIMNCFKEDSEVGIEEYLLTTIKDPELAIYAFLHADLDIQKKLIKIQESSGCPEHKEVIHKEIILPSDLPHFSKHWNAMTIEGKEIWKLEMYTNEWYPTINYYVIVDTENNTNQIYFSEYNLDPEKYPEFTVPLFYYMHY